MLKHEIRRRRSVRIPGNDYALPRAYFVTICTYRKSLFFGDVKNGIVTLNLYGEAAIIEWFRTTELREYVILFEDEFILMPNHVHGIIHIKHPSGAVGARHRHAPTEEKFGMPRSGTRGTMIRAYKSAVTRRVNKIRGTPAMKVWQRNYYEHIIRDESELNRICCYIRGNPALWHGDVYFVDGG